MSKSSDFIESPRQSRDKFQIKSKIQISNNIQIPISKQYKFRILNLRYWCLFGIWCLVLVIFLISAYSAYAVDYLPLVPCGLQVQPTDKEGNRIGDPTVDYTRECTTCDFFRLGQNSIDFILQGFLPPVATFFFILAGAFILLGGANLKLVATGKQMFKYTVIGILIISASYMLVTTILKALVPGDLSTNWNKITCTTTVGVGGRLPVSICSDPASLASQNNVPFPPQNDPELGELIACIKNKLPNENLGSVFTFEEENTLCNYARGDDVCGQCAHVVNSCHYGGASGNRGALAVDFGNQLISDKIIKAALECGAKSARCENANGPVDCRDSSAEHVHVNSKSCDRN